MTTKLLRGDCREVMRTLAPNSVDAIVTDPPYGLEFMGKDWDSFKTYRGGNPNMKPQGASIGSRGGEEWQPGSSHGYRQKNPRCRTCGKLKRGNGHCKCPEPSWDTRTSESAYQFQCFNEYWAVEALRVLKPGGHLLAFSGSRTYHRMVCAIEDAGFEVRDQIMWVYGSGFPKSLNVSRAIDIAAGADREVVGKYDSRSRIDGATRTSKGVYEKHITGEKTYGSIAITAPATPAAREWQGWGTALKPAHEPIVLARKPLSESTVAANVLRWGTGALNIDGCRVATEPGNYASGGKNDLTGTGWGHKDATRTEQHKLGRWPANLCHDGSDEVLRTFPETTSGVKNGGNYERETGVHEGGQRRDGVSCFGDSGSAARFFYCAKASKKDRDAGLSEMPEHSAGVMQDDAYKWQVDGKGNKINLDTKRRNVHPTVKPTALMAYLCRLVTPSGGVVLDPFMGSGSTGRGAILEGFDFIGVEMSEEYLTIARLRIADAQREAAEPRPKAKAKGGKPGRWPANLIHDNSAEVVGLFPETGAPKQARVGRRGGSAWHGCDGFGSPDKTGTWPADTGGSAARFFKACEPDAPARVTRKRKETLQSPIRKTSARRAVRANRAPGARPGPARRAAKARPAQGRLAVG
jgi:DNA modification methylase